jgi:hypothetical protein
VTVTDQYRRALTARELDTISQRIRDAADTGQLLNDGIGAVYNALLADTGRTLHSFGDGSRLDVTAFAIPATQWTAIVAAITRRAQQWGTGPLLALELVNLMPSTYNDPNTPTPDLPQPDYRPTTYRLHVHRDAVDVIAACEAHLTALHDYYGATSTTFQKAWQSWHHNLIGLFIRSTGVDTHISKDGPRSLYVQTSSGLVYGLIFHGATRHCTTTGCAALIDDTGTARPSHSTATVLNHPHTPSYPIGAPQPGEWSFHS